jgi:hypothetical protein
MDKATGWPEFVAIKNKLSYHISILFDSEWLCRYPALPRSSLTMQQSSRGKSFKNY